MQEQQVQELSGLLLQTRSQRELETLLRVLLTPQELDVIARRWHLIEMLLKGTTQREISQALGISLGKIARGSRLLKYGPPEFRDLAQRLVETRTAPDRPAPPP